MPAIFVAFSLLDHLRAPRVQVEIPINMRDRHDSRSEADPHLVTHPFLFDRERKQLLLKLPRSCYGIPVAEVFRAFGTVSTVPGLEHVGLLRRVPVKLCEAIGFNLMGDVCTEHKECLALRQVFGAHDLLGAVQQVLFRLEVLHLVCALASTHKFREHGELQLLLVHLNDSWNEAE